MMIPVRESCTESASEQKRGSFDFVCTGFGCIRVNGEFVNDMIAVIIVAHSMEPVLINSRSVLTRRPSCVSLMFGVDTSSE